MTVMSRRFFSLATKLRAVCGANFTVFAACLDHRCIPDLRAIANTASCRPRRQRRSRPLTAVRAERRLLTNPFVDVGW